MKTILEIGIEEIKEWKMSDKTFEFIKNYEEQNPKVSIGSLISQSLNTEFLKFLDQIKLIRSYPSSKFMRNVNDHVVGYIISEPYTEAKNKNHEK